MMPGHIGNWGSCIGKWQRLENRVVFTELSGEDQMKACYCSLIFGRRWRYKVLARSLEEFNTGRTQSWIKSYVCRCEG